MNELTESTVKQEALSVEEQAQAIVITNNTEYESAVTILKSIKESKQRFIDFFAPAKKAAAAAHKAICANEKSCTDPCDKAESIIKGKMLDYSRRVEAERRALEEEQRKAQQAEADKLLAEAAKAEEQGDTLQATVNMAMAEQMASIKPAVQVVAPKVSGVSTKKVWKVKITDEKSVPSYVSGVCIRPVDTKKLLDLRRLNPNVEITGISFVQDSALSVR